MDEPKFTPGPWRVTGSMSRYDREIAGPNNEDLAYVNASDGADEPTIYPLKANADLIAAAPDLYAALKDVLGIARAATMHSGGDHNRKRIAAAEAALAKAAPPPPVKEQGG